MTRDDVDRLLVMGSAIGLFGLATLLPFDGGTVVVAFILFWVTVLIGAFAFFRHARWAQPWLVRFAIVWLAGAAFVAMRDIRAILGVVAALAMLVGAIRARIPPETRRTQLPAGEPDDTPSVFRAVDDWRDDAELDAFAASAGRLDHPDLAFLAATWRAGGGAARDRALRAARSALTDPDRRRAFEAISAEIRAWSQSAVGPWTWEWGAMTDIDRGDRRRAAIPALVDAAAAIIARDAISDEDRETLLGPWLATLAGRPVDDSGQSVETAAPA